MLQQLSRMRHNSSIILSGVTDIIITIKEDDDVYFSTPFYVRIGKIKYVEKLLVKESFMQHEKQVKQVQLTKIGLSINGVIVDVEFYLNILDQRCYFIIQNENHQELSSIPNQNQIKSFNLKKGVNQVQYQITCQKYGNKHIDTRIFFMDYKQKIFVSDFDGTITKQPVLGMFLSIFGLNYTQKLICTFLALLQQRGIMICYMSARSLVQYNSTKEYIERQQENEYVLPDGPILLSDLALMDALNIEIIKKQSNLLKSRLLKEIQVCVADNSIVGGIGDRYNDVTAYKSIGLCYSQIFHINKKAQVVRINQQGIKEKYSLSDIISKLDILFPCIN